MTMALCGLRVVEWSSGRMGSYAAKLLADFGADVSRVEFEGVQSSPGNAVWDDWMHGGKTRVVLPSLGAAATREEFRALLGDADILFVDQPMRTLEAHGLEPEALVRSHPGLVLVVCTLAGLGDRSRQLSHSDLVATAIGGLAWRTPPWAARSADNPPLRLGGNQADYATGLLAASAALSGLQQRRRTGAGVLLDVSAQATIASFMRWEAAFVTYNTLPPERTERLSLHNLIRCLDGHVAVMMVEQYQWEGLKRMLGEPSWIMRPEFVSISDIAAHWHEIEPGLLEWARDRKKNEIFLLAQSHRVPLFPLNDVQELILDPQQVARRAFPRAGADGVPMPGAIVHLSATPSRNDGRTLDAAEGGA